MEEASFSSFSKLPPEIRFMIWKFSATEGRIVPIQYQSHLVLYTPRLRPPAMLHTSRESRQEGLKIYHELRLGPFTNIGCYVDLTKDIVYLRINMTNFQDRFIPLSTDPSLLFQEMPQFRTRCQYMANFLTRPRRGEAHPLRSIYLPARTHSKMILNDLLESEDGQQIFRNFQTDIPTFRRIQKYYQYYRHQISLIPERLCLIHESGDGPLPKDIVLSEIKESLGEAETVARKLASSFRAQNVWRNKRDVRNNLSARLVQKIILKRVNGNQRRDE